MKLTKSPSLFPTMSNFFDDFFTRDLTDWTHGNFSNTNTTIPAVNVLETADNYVVEMASPGMRKEDFEIELADNMLTIRSEVRSKNRHEEREHYKRREFSYQSFERSFRLNNNVVDDQKIEATYEHGVLRLTIPKKEEAKTKPPRLIEIS